MRHISILSATLAMALACLVGSATAGVYSDTILADGPLAYWRLGEASGPTVFDETSGSHDGTADAGVLFGQSSLVSSDAGNTAIGTSGSNRVVVSGFEKYPSGSTGYTTEYWITVNTAVAGFHNIVGDGESGGDFYMMNYLTDTSRIRPHFAGNSPISIDSNTQITVGLPYHVVTMWDQTSGTGSIYINGVLDTSTAVTTNAPSNSNNPMYLGKDNREPGGDFTLDEVAFYNKPLSATDVQGHYLVGTFGHAEFGPGKMTLPASYWSFDESASGTGPVADRTDGNHGTFVGGASRTSGLIGAGAAAVTHAGGVDVSNGVGHVNDFAYAKGVTVEALILPNADLGNNSYEEIFRKEDGSNRILLSFQENGGFLSFGINDGTGYHELDMPLDGLAGRPLLADLKDGDVHHIVAAYDSDSGLKGIYVDGQLAYSTVVGAGTDMVSGGATVAYVGNSLGLGEPFSGVIDEVAIYDVALSLAEIRYHYANVLLGNQYFAVPEPSTAALGVAGMLALVGLALRRRRLT